MNTAVEVRDMGAQVAPIVQQAEAIIIGSPVEYDQAALFLTKIKTMAKEVEAERIKGAKPLNEAIRAHNEHFKRWSVPLETSERTVKTKMQAWYMEQERIREEAASKARDEARRKEEAEREKLQRQAAAAEAKGRAERAEELKAQAAAVYVEPAFTPAQAESTVVTSKGAVTMRQDIEIEVVNPYELLEAIMKDELPLAWIKIDVQAIKRRARADSLQPGSTALPGVRIKPAIVSAVRTINATRQEPQDLN
jgi:hypothetical protein